MVVSNEWIVATFVGYESIDRSDMIEAQRNYPRTQIAKKLRSRSHQASACRCDCISQYLDLLLAALDRDRVL